MGSRISSTLESRIALSVSRPDVEHARLEIQFLRDRDSIPESLPEAGPPYVMLPRDSSECQWAALILVFLVPSVGK